MRDDDQLIEDWLAQRPPRRFLAADTGTREGMQRYLEERGYRVRFRWNPHGGVLAIHKAGERGAPRFYKTSELPDFVDQVRVREGLSPLRLVGKSTTNASGPLPDTEPEGA